MPPLARLSLATLLALATAGTARAHSELPSSGWCAGGDVVEVASFEILPATLADLREDDKCPPEGTPIEKDCGQFDDDYALAKNASAQACAAYAGRPGRGAASDAGSIVVLVESPAEYLVESHHADYSLELGLRGMCVRCEIGAQQPPRQLQPDF